MDLQTLFYLVATISILGWFVFLIFLSLVLFNLYRQTQSLVNSFNEKLENPPFQALFSILPLFLILIPIIKAAFKKSRS